MTCKVSKRLIYSNPYPQAGLGICSLVFQTNCWFFCEQKSKSVIHLLFRAITLLLFLKECHEQIAHFCSFDMSDLSKSLRSHSFVKSDKENHSSRSLKRVSEERGEVRDSLLGKKKGKTVKSNIQNCLFCKQFAQITSESCMSLFFKERQE